MKLKLKITMNCLTILNIISFSLAYPLVSAQSGPPNRKLLRTMQSFMDLKADPCQDFYRYACGNWENLLPPNVDYLDTIGSLEYEINHKLKILLQGKTFKQKKRKNLIYHKVYEYYKTCKEQQTYNALEYLSIMKPSEWAEWPAIGNVWLNQKPWNILSFLGRLLTVGFNGFLITLELKSRNATHFYVHLDKQQDLGFTSYEQRLLDEMDNSLLINTRLVSQNIQSFINNLAVLHTNHKRNYALEMSLDELQGKVLHLDFKSYFAFIVRSESLQHLPLMVANLDYFRKLSDLVQKTSSTTLIHTLRLKFLGYMEKQMPQNTSSFKCLQHMRELVPLALDYIYEMEIYQYKRNATEFVIRKLFSNMKRKFADIINEHSQELSYEDRIFLKQKIYQMKLNIGNLPVGVEEKYYHKLFDSWQVYEGLFYWNHLNALQHQSMDKFRVLNQPSYSVLHTYFRWPFGSPAYQPSANLLIIPHTYLQYPIFQANFHELFQYAELGNTLGHEMLHAFDTNGLQYDSQGNPSAFFIKKLPDKKFFMDSLQCLNKQKPSSLNEKIADLSGFRLAYETYFHRPLFQKFRSETFYFNDKQLFFIKFAQFFCAVNPKRIHYDDSHDTPFLRVAQVVANHNEFEEIFGCPQKTNQFMPEKCNLW